MNSNKMEKHFRTIAETAEETGISMSKIRFWETKIPQLKPHRNEHRTRFYTEEDIELIKIIDYLQKVKNLTIEGIVKKLRENANLDDLKRKQKIYETLLVVRKELQELYKML